MSSRTISLEEGAYQGLKAAKRPGESFSEVVRRLLGGRESSLLDLEGLLDESSAKRVSAAIDRMTREDIAAQRTATRRGRRA